MRRYAIGKTGLGRGVCGCLRKVGVYGRVRVYVSVCGWLAEVVGELVGELVGEWVDKWAGRRVWICTCATEAEGCKESKGGICSV